MQKSIINVSHTSLKIPGFDKIICLVIFLVLLQLFTGCNEQARGFALPEGSELEGKRYFTELVCNQCHSVANVEWIGIEDEDVNIHLGGKVSKVKTYGELLTSIINPSHRIDPKFSELVIGQNRSPMKIYNEAMTVQQLVDIVAFLQIQYKVIPPPTTYPRW
jgi:hypothetical protein